MSDFEGASVYRPDLERLGFKVESVEAVEKDLAGLRESNPEMRERRLAPIASSRHGQHQFSSPNGVFIDISVT